MAIQTGKFTILLKIKIIALIIFYQIFGEIISLDVCCLSKSEFIKVISVILFNLLRS